MKNGGWSEENKISHTESFVGDEFKSTEQQNKLVTFKPYQKQTILTQNHYTVQLLHKKANSLIRCISNLCQKHIHWLPKD